jgi:hypothetical protein
MVDAATGITDFDNTMAISPEVYQTGFLTVNKVIIAEIA